MGTCGSKKQVEPSTGDVRGPHGIAAGATVAVEPLTAIQVEPITFEIKQKHEQQQEEQPKDDLVSPVESVAIVKPKDVNRRYAKPTKDEEPLIKITETPQILPATKPEPKKSSHNELLARRRKSSLGDLQISRLRDSRAVRVFISSTFRDFALERDYLNRHALPELRKIGEERGVTIVFVDLRWGVTSEESSNGAVVKLCLSEIDACRPFFVAMLGERYGWHLDPESPDALLEQTLDIGEDNFPWVGSYRTRSVTELEILHGCLLDPAAAPYASFYFRQHEPFLKEMHSQIPESELSVFEAETELASKAQSRLKEEIESKFMGRIFQYSRIKEFSDKLVADLTRAIDAEFQFDAACITKHFKIRMQHEAFAGSRRMGYICPDDIFKTLQDHCEANDNRGIAVIGESGAGKSALLANWADHQRDSNPRAVVFVHYVGCTAESTDHYHIIKRIFGDLCERLLIEDETTDAELTEMELVEKLPDFLASASTRAAEAGQYIVLVLDGLDQLEDKGNAHSLFWLPKVPNVRMICSIKGDANMLVAAKAKRNSIEHAPVRSRIQSMSGLVDGSSGINAAKVSDGISECLKYWIRKKWPTICMRELNKGEQRSAIVGYLATHAKKLDEKQIDLVMKASPASNPLYLRTLLDEARLFGNFFQLTSHLESLLEAQTNQDLYSKVIRRMEEECGKELVNHTMAFILTARDGLNDDEIRAILTMEEVSNVVSFTHETDVPFYRMCTDEETHLFVQLRFAVREQLCSLSGMMTFVHDAVRQAVHSHIGGEEVCNRAHARLANYFDMSCPSNDNGILTDDGHETLPSGIDAASTTDKASTIRGRAAASAAAASGQSPSVAVQKSIEEGKKLDSGLDQRWRRKLRELPWHLQRSGQVDRLAKFLSTTVVLQCMLADDSGKYELVRYWRYIDEVWKAELASKTQQGILSDDLEVGASAPMSLASARSGMGASQRGGALAFMQTKPGVAAHAPTKRPRTSMEEYLAAVGLEAATVVQQGLHQRARANGGATSKTSSAEDTKNAETKSAAEQADSRVRMEQASEKIDRVATLLVLLGKYDQAGKIREKELTINQTLYGEVHFKVSISCSELAKVYEKAAKYDRSMELKRQAVQIDAQLLGPDHEELAIGYDNLAFLHLKLGQYNESRELYMESLRIKERTCGREHRDVAQTLCSLGLMYEELGRLDEALVWYEKGLKIREKAFGPAHPSVARSLVDLGMLHMKLGKQFNVALEQLQHGYDILSKVLGEDHADVAAAANNLGLVYANMKDFKNALNYYHHAKDIQRQRLGGDHPSYAATCCNIASVCQELAQRAKENEEYEQYTKEAEEHYSTALLVYKVKLGIGHPDTATAMHNVGTLFFERGLREIEMSEDASVVQGRGRNYLQQAHKNFEQALAIRMSLFGESHTSTQNSNDAMKRCEAYLSGGTINLPQDPNDDMVERCATDDKVLRALTARVFMQFNVSNSDELEVDSDQFRQLVDLWAEEVGVDCPEHQDYVDALEHLTLPKDKLSANDFARVMRQVLVANYMN